MKRLFHLILDNLSKMKYVGITNLLLSLLLLLAALLPALVQPGPIFAAAYKISPYSTNYGHIPLSAEVWVDADNGSDGNPGTRAEPFKTIQYGVNMVATGGTVHVLSGTYHESVTIDKANLTVSGQSGAILQGSIINGFTVEQPGVTIQGFTIQGFKDYGISVQDSADDCSILNNIIKDNLNIGIIVDVPGAVMIQGNQIYDNGAEGIYIISGNSGTIDDNVVHDNDVIHAGIYLRHCSNFQVVNNEIYNEAYGVYLAASDECTIQNNSIHDNGHGIYVTSGSEACSDKNKIIGNSIISNKQTMDSGIHLTQYANGTIINFNVIVGNCSAPVLYGVCNENTAETVNAENNWWGANNGPNPSGDGDKVSDYVDYDPWLVLDISADPGSIYAGGPPSNIIADLTGNSAGNNTASQGHIPDGTEIIFTTDKGSIGSLQITKPTTDGKAEAALTSAGDAGTATVCAEAPHGAEVPEAEYQVCTEVELRKIVSPKPFEDTASPSMPAQTWAKPADTKVLTASVQPAQVVAGQPVTIMANVANRGDLNDSYVAQLSINGQVETTKQLMVPGNGALPVEFTVIKDKPGIYEVDINGQKAYFTVVGAQDDTSPATVVYIILGILIAVALILGVVFTLRRGLTK